MKEEWRVVRGYPHYNISNFGRILSNHFWPVKILKQVKGERGYLFVCLREKGYQRNLKVHRLVAIAFLENPLNKPEVNHKDLNRSNSNLTNLEWVTKRENRDHAISAGANFKRPGNGQNFKKKKICDF